MKTLNLVQGNQEWHDVRAKHYTASEAAAMLGLSKYQTRDELLYQKKTGVAKEVTEGQQYIFDQGHDAEASARHHAEDMIENELFPVVGSLEVDGLSLLASFDGLTINGAEAWEHKLWNKELAIKINRFDVPDTHWPQLEQQLLVSGAEAIFLTVSDGTRENWESVVYKSVSSRRAALIAGWKQFKKDLENYEVPEMTIKPEAKAITKLPTLSISIKGEVQNTNLAEYKETVETFIESINTELTTDQHFADAERTIKFCKDAEKELETVKAMILSQAADINDTMNVVDDLKAGMRQQRLTLEKLTKSEKEKIKNNLIEKGLAEVSEHAEELMKDLNGMTLENISCDFYGVVKGLKTKDSFVNAVNTEVARWKIEADKAAIGIRENLAAMKELASDHRFLFSDWKTIITKDKEDFTAMVKVRISEHEEAEKQKAETKRIAEEAAKIESEKAQDQQAEKSQEKTDIKPVIQPQDGCDENSQVVLSEYQRGYIDCLHVYVDKDSINVVIREFMKKDAV